MAKLEIVEYEARARCTGGREGHVVSSDGELDLNLAMPIELTGKGGAGSNPEQLFAASYAAAFIGAMRAAGEMREMELPEDVTIDATVGVGTAPGGYGIYRFACHGSNRAFPPMWRQSAVLCLGFTHCSSPLRQPLENRNDQPAVARFGSV